MNRRMWAYVGIVFLLVCLPACDLAPLLGPGQAPQQQALLVETEVVAAPGQCRVTVTVHRPAQDVELDVRVMAEAGIHFVATGGQQSETQTVEIMAQEVLPLDYDCYLVPDEIQLPGAYTVRATAFLSNTEQKWEENVAALYVYADDAGRRQFIADAGEFEHRYGNGYAQGTNAIRYQVALEDAPYPSRGLLHLRVDSPGGRFASTLALRLGNGVQFMTAQVAGGAGTSPPVRVDSTQTAHVPLAPIAPGGSRIVTVPFRMASNTRPGEYSLRVTVYGDAGQWEEVAPVFVVVKNDPDHPQNTWLTQEQRQAMAVTPGTGGLSAQQSNGPAVPTLPAPLPTAVAPTPTVPAGPEQRASLVWDGRLSGFHGNRWQLWQQIRANAPISWEQFKGDVVRYNPHLAADGYVFLPHKSYVMPRGTGYDETVAQ